MSQKQIVIEDPANPLTIVVIFKCCRCAEVAEHTTLLKKRGAFCIPDPPDGWSSFAEKLYCPKHKLRVVRQVIADDEVLATTEQGVDGQGYFTEPI